MSKIYTSADQLIGKTPLLELSHIEKAEKLEKERAERATKLANLKSQAEEIKKQIADLEKDAKTAESVRTSRPS